MLLALLAACGSPGDPSADSLALRTFLQKHYRPYDDGDPTVQYAVAAVSLDDHTPMRLVYVSGNAWCGSGGCSALLVALQGSSFRVLDEWSLVELPICILPGAHHGWHDIAMRVHGSDRPDFTGVTGYDGKRYSDSTLTEEKPPGFHCDAVAFSQATSLYAASPEHP